MHAWRNCKGLGSLLSYPLPVATLCFNPAEGPQTASRSAECRPAELPYVLALDLRIHGGPPNVDFTLTLRLVHVWIRIRLSMMVIVFVFSVWVRRLRPIFPFPKSNSASQYANDDWQRPTSIVDLTAREPCRIFTFAKHVSFEHSTGIPCPVISSRREGNINKRTKLKSFLTLDRRSVSPHRPACVRALRGQWAIWLAPRLSLATESTGTVLIPSQMSEIAGHDEHRRSTRRCSKASCKLDCLESH